MRLTDFFIDLVVVAAVGIIVVFTVFAVLTAVFTAIFVLLVFVILIVLHVFTPFLKIKPTPFIGICAYSRTPSKGKCKST